MNFEAYIQYFESIINTPQDKQKSPYDSPEYFNYTQLNWSRLNRWLKKGVLLPETKSVLQQISLHQHWLVITEPWCGDAAHIVPFIELMSRENELIHVEYELRDSAPHTINNYLTKKSKSIPKLVIRDENQQDIAVWGPRPVDCAQLFNQLKAADKSFEELKIALQKWYNEDQGIAIQKEISFHLSNA